MVNGFPELVYKDRKEDQLEFGPNATSLDLLRAIYRSPQMPLHTRMRAAMACLKHEHPTLGITFQTTNSDFAELLDRRIKHMEELKLIEHQPQPKAVELKPSTPQMRRRI